MNHDLFDAPLGPLAVAFSSTTDLGRFPDPDPVSLLATALWDHAPEVALFILRPPTEHLATYRNCLKLMTSVLLEAEGDTILGAHLAWWDGGTHPLTAPTGGWPRGAAAMRKAAGRWSGYGAIGLWPAEGDVAPADALALTTCEVHIVRPGYARAADELAHQMFDPNRSPEQKRRLSEVFAAAWR